MRFERALYHDSKRFAKDERAVSAARMPSIVTGFAINFKQAMFWCAPAGSCLTAGTNLTGICTDGLHACPFSNCTSGKADRR
jgi:hypothetical protein